MNFFSSNLLVFFFIILSSYSFLYYIFANNLKVKVFNFIFFYHLFFSLAFFLFAKNNDTDSFKFFTDAFNKNYSGNYFFFGSNFIKKISSVIIEYFKFDYLNLNLLFGFFGTSGILILASIAQKKIHHESIYFYLIFLAFCTPSLNFFTSYLGKDSLIFFSICLFIWSIDDFNKYKIISLIFSLYIIISTRLHIAIPIILVFALFVPFIYHKTTNFFKIIYYSFYLLILFFVLYYQVEILVKAGVISGLGGMSLNPGLFNYEYIIQKMSVYSNNTSLAQSTYKLQHDNNFIYYFKYLFGPFVFESGTQLKYLVVKIENLYYFFLVIILFFMVGLNINNKKIFVKNLMLILIFFALTIPLSLSVSNYGISIRQRVTIYPFLIYMFIFNIEYLLNEKKINSYIFKSNYN